MKLALIASLTSSLMEAVRLAGVCGCWSLNCQEGSSECVQHLGHCWGGCETVKVEETPSLSANARSPQTRVRVLVY